MGVAGAAVAALSLLVLSGCSGAADAAPTVGPTAGATEAAEPTEYEPTLPPYTTEVDLSAEDEAEVEELLLLIDSRVVEQESVIIGSGIRGSKIMLPGAALADLPAAEVVEDLAIELP